MMRMDPTHSNPPPAVPTPYPDVHRAQAPSATLRLQDAYAHCLALARCHYENFPVASLLLPRELRKPVTVIYAFTRTATDLASRSEQTAEERIMALAGLEAKLDILKAGGTLTDALFVALAHVLARYPLPTEALYDLLRGCRMDVERTRYASFRELIDYCRCTANPVGRLLLHLYRTATPPTLACADAICTAVQLMRVIGNVGADYHQRGRIYLPQDEMARFGVTEEHFRGRYSDEPLFRLVGLQLDRVRRLLAAGAPLAASLKGRARLEVRLVLSSAACMLQRLQTRQDPFTRPGLGPRDWVWIGWRAVSRRKRSVR
jgi:squalene synthase HpnC